MCHLSPDWGGECQLSSDWGRGGFASYHLIGVGGCQLSSDWGGCQLSSDWGGGGGGVPVII